MALASEIQSSNDSLLPVTCPDFYCASGALSFETKSSRALSTASTVANVATGLCQNSNYCKRRSRASAVQHISGPVGCVSTVTLELSGQACVRQMSSNDVDMPDPVEVAQPEHEPLMEAVEESPDTDMDGG